MEKKKDVGSQMRFSDHELKLVQATFKDNIDLLKLMRKVFLPELDPKAPLSQNIDLWMTLDLNGDPEQVLINIKARNLLITHIEQRLMELQGLSHITIETEEEKAIREKKDSTK